jgi:acyl carrier protein
MKKELENIKKTLNLNKNVNLETELNTLEQWDSMGALSIIGLADAKYKKIISGDDLFKCKKIIDIIKLLKE